MIVGYVQNGFIENVLENFYTQIVTTKKKLGMICPPMVMAKVAINYAD
jgi:hypothetical protein